MSGSCSESLRSHRLSIVEDTLVYGYKSVILARRGPPEVLQVVESDLRDPLPGEARIRVIASAVGRTDVMMRYGYYPYAPRLPFVPGYQMIGQVDAVGPGVTSAAAGDCVAALTVYGGYSEYIYLGEEHLVPVPPGVDPAEGVTLILNYVTAYQMIHRVAKVKPGETALITGASGGVGMALMELGKLAGLKMYGSASPSKHDRLIQFGVTPIDYHRVDMLSLLLDLEPNGLDYIFDGIGGKNIENSFRILGQGGILVEYGFPGFRALLIGIGKLQWLNLLPNGKTGKFYGVTAWYRKDKHLFQGDLIVLFRLLKEGKIKPFIAAKFPILEAAKANEMIENGGGWGQIVLLSPELL